MISARMGTATTEAGEPEQLSDEQNAGDREHRWKVDLPLHDHRRDEVGLDEVHADAERR